MAERTVVVRLKALVDDYKRAMGQAGKATADVARQADNWRSMGQSAANLGDSMTRSLTLPIVAVGAAAVKMAADFDASFVTMTTLAGVSAGEVDALKESVLGLAGEVGRSPQELAEALYFLQSSGLDSAAAMDALEMSAKASAAGLGSTIQIADAVSSAMNAYARSGLSAAEATDVLVATARAGKAEPAELAQQMGRVLPVASELGVTFNDVGAAIAALSLGGNDAAASTTQLLNILMKMVRPSQQGAEALEAVGLSVQDLEGMIAEQGLLGTLEELKARLGDSGFRTFLEDGQAITAGLALTGENVEQVRGVFEDLADTTGDTESAFEKWAESMGATNARAFADLQVAMIRFGEILAPIVSSILDFASGFAEAFSKLPDGAQKAVVAGAMVVAAMGPILSIGGRLVSMGATLASALVNWAVPADAAAGAFNRTGTAASTASTGLGRLTRALTTGTVVLGGWIAAGQIADQVFNRGQPANVSELENALLELGRTGTITGELQDNWHDLSNAIGDVFSPTNVERVGNLANEVVHLGGAAGSTHLDRMKDELDAVDQALAQLARRDPEEAAAALDMFIERMAQSAEQGDAIRSAMDAYDAALAEIDTSEATQGTGELGEELAATGEAAQEATSALQTYVDTLRAQFDPLFAMQDALRGASEAQSAVAAAEMELVAAREEYGPASLEALAAEQALVDARNDGARSAVDLRVAATELNDAMINEGLSAEAAAAQLAEMAMSAGFTREQAILMADALLTAAGEADDLGATDPTVETDTEGYPETMVRLLALESQANQVAGRRVVHASVENYHETQVRLGSLRSAADHIPRNITISVGLSGASEAIRQAQIIAGYRAAGGPVAAGRLYEVAEQGKAELLEMGAHTYLIPGNDGRVVPADAMSGPMMSAMALGGGGGSAVVVNVSMAGAIIASQRDAQRWVSQAWNSATRHGMVNIKPEAVRR